MGHILHVNHRKQLLLQKKKLSNALPHVDVESQRTSHAVSCSHKKHLQKGRVELAAMVSFTVCGSGCELRWAGWEQVRVKWYISVKLPAVMPSDVKMKIQLYEICRPCSIHAYLFGGGYCLQTCPPQRTPIGPVILWPAQNNLDGRVFVFFLQRISCLARLKLSRK